MVICIANCLELEVNSLANSKTAKKRVLINEKKHKCNASARSDLRTALKKAKTALADNNEDKTALVTTASSKLDRAVSKGLIHKNTANRRKSRLAKALNTASAE